MTTLDNFKKQASRLADYLGRNHRVSLKRAAALEAVAQMHGARNWQTLSANGVASSEHTSDAGWGSKLLAKRMRSWTRRADLDERPVRVTGTDLARKEWFALALADHLALEHLGLFLGVPDALVPFVRDSGGMPLSLTALREVVESKAGLDSLQPAKVFCVAESTVRDPYAQELIRAICAGLVNRTFFDKPLTVAVMDSDGTLASVLLPSSIFRTARAHNIQVLVGQLYTATPLESENTFTEVALTLDRPREVELITRARNAGETRFSANGDVSVRRQ